PRGRRPRCPPARRTRCPPVVRVLSAYFSMHPHGGGAGAAPQRHDGRRGRRFRREIAREALAGVAQVALVDDVVALEHARRLPPADAPDAPRIVHHCRLRGTSVPLLPRQPLRCLAASPRQRAAARGVTTQPAPHSEASCYTPAQSHRDSRAPCSSSRGGGTGMRTGRLQAGVTLVLVLAAVARAATITVNSMADAVVNDGNCTLREAIL